MQVVVLGLDVPRGTSVVLALFLMELDLCDGGGEGFGDFVGLDEEAAGGGGGEGVHGVGFAVGG